MAERFERLLAEIAPVDPRLAETTRQIEAGWATGDPHDAEMTELVAEVLANGVRHGLYTIPSAVEGFSTFAHDFLDRQPEFLRTGAYRARDYATVSREVYENEEFMRRVYYPALLLSYLASPNYRHILRRLDRTLAAWRDEKITRLLEVASGHGLLLLYALRELSEATGIGTDVAPAAAGFAAALHAATGWGGDRFRFLLTDVLDGDAAHPEVAGPFDAAICCELLEHVPEPALFLRAIHDRLRTGGRLFVSAAVRMESVDHLTLFGSTLEVAALLRENGFAVVEEMSVPFVTRRPRDEAHWSKLLENRLVAATFVADCRRVP